MKKLLLFLALPVATYAQICNPAGNLMIFSNYDGGILNINIDVNIPNLKIGVVTYEAVEINLSGTYLNNLTEIRYAGYNSNNNHCGPTIATTVINNLPGGATSNIVLYPPATLSNPNGNNSIICAYSCDNSSNQGGCNTVDQVEDYFLTYFAGSNLYAHHTQYNCWSGTMSLSAGGNCCPLNVPLTVSIAGLNASCYQSCDGTATATPNGGTPPYSYAWSNGLGSGQSVNGLCAGTYSVTITDDIGGQILEQITITEPQDLQVNSTIVHPACSGENGSATLSISGGTAPYYENWGTADPALLPNGSYPVTITDANGCSTSQTITIVEPSPLSATFTVVPTINPCDGSATVLVSGGTSPYTYLWDAYSGNQTTTTAVNLCVGLHCVTVTDGNGCDETFCQAMTSVAGIADQDEFSFLQVYPNPSEGQLTLQFDQAPENEYRLKVLDFKGRLIRQQLIELDGKSDTETLLIHEKGMYYLVLEGDKHTTTIKVLIH